MYEPLISIIMPVYNSEQYLENAIESVLKQSYRNIELLIIDDGSTDASAKICDDYSNKDSRVVVKHKKNGGQASARNIALELAQGEYIGFVDADDWVETSMYSTLYLKLKEYNASLAICNCELLSSRGHKSYWQPVISEEIVFDNYELMKELLYNQRINEMFCNKLFKREAIINERFVEKMIFEDTEMMHRCLANVDKAIYVSSPFYKIFLSEGSTTRQPIQPKHFDRIIANKHRIKFYKENYPKLVTLANDSYVNVCMDLIDRSTNVKVCRKIRQETIEELRLFLQQNEIEKSRKGKLAQCGAKISGFFFYLCLRFPYYFCRLTRLSNK